MTTAQLDPPVATRAEPLGPDSLTWRMTGDWRGLLLAGRILVLQVAHPVVGAGVGEHSVYKTDPYGRIDRTFKSALAQVYGGAQAAEEGRRLREMHRDIKGVDAQGRRYSALNPEAYFWVHATAYEFSLVFFRLFDEPLDEARTAQLFEEWRRSGQILGIPERHLPATQAEFWEMWERVTGQLENNPVVQDLLYNPPKPPPFVPAFVQNALGRRFLSLRRDLVSWTLEPRLRELMGLPELTAQQERRLERLAGGIRLAGRLLPEPLLIIPAARKARRQALVRLSSKESA